MSVLYTSYMCEDRRCVVSPNRVISMKACLTIRHLGEDVEDFRGYLKRCPEAPLQLEGSITYMYNIWCRPPPPWYGPGRSIGPGTWHAFAAPSLGDLPPVLPLFPHLISLNRNPCKCYRILHHLQTVRLHQPAFPHIHKHSTHSHRGRGREP